MSDFLPQDYSAPEGGNSDYFKPATGKNQVRILTPPVIGYIGWDKTGDTPTPVRARSRQDIPAHAEDTKHFWAVEVYNRDVSDVQVWELTQKSIMLELQNLSRDPNWGHPKGYDLIIEKTGSNLETRYHITPVPPAPAGDDIRAAFKARPCDLEAIFDGSDPFQPAPTESDEPF